MIEERYIKINTCQKCEYAGHSFNGREFVFICSNPMHGDIETKRIRIGEKFYPITGKDNLMSGNLIPKWCKLEK